MTQLVLLGARALPPDHTRMSVMCMPCMCCGAPRLAHALAALLHEHADLRAPRLALDHADDLGVGDEGRAGDELAAVLLDEEHLVDRDFLARLASTRSTVTAARGDLHLAPAALDDRKHVPLRPASPAWRLIWLLTKD
jgi:hypothetical protein